MIRSQTFDVLPKCGYTGARTHRNQEKMEEMEAIILHFKGFFPPSPLNDQFDMRHLNRKQKAIEKEEPFLYEGR